MTMMRSLYLTALSSLWAIMIDDPFFALFAARRASSTCLYEPSSICEVGSSRSSKRADSLVFAVIKACVRARSCVWPVLNCFARVSKVKLAASSFVWIKLDSRKASSNTSSFIRPTGSRFCLNVSFEITNDCWRTTLRDLRSCCKSRSSTDLPSIST